MNHTFPFFLALLGTLAPRLAADEPPPGPWFVDVARAKGLPAEGACHRNAWVDLDGDGWFDACLDNQRLFKNEAAPGGGRRLVELPGALGLLEGARRPDLVLWADVDGDGDADAYLGFRGAPAQLRIQSDGRFARRPEPGLELSEAPICGAWLDYDRDGWLDLAIGQDYVPEAGLQAFPLRLFRGGPGGFVDVTSAAGLSQQAEPGHPDSRRPLYGLTACDWNGDGWPDLLCAAYGRQWNLLWRNQGDRTFSEVGAATGFDGDADRSGAYPEETKRWFKEQRNEERKDEPPFRSNGNSFEAAPADVDNDGDLDLFLAEITHAWAGPSSDRSSLLENLGPPGFAFRRDPDAMPRIHVDARWNQGDLYAGWLDADGDGRLDLLLASGDYPDQQLLRLFRQGDRLAFSDHTERAGFAWESSAQPSLCDWDKDGDLDVLVGNSAMRMPAGRITIRPALFECRVERPWLNVRLQARGKNRAGLGARLELQAGEGRPVVRELSGGRGHAGRTDASEAVFTLPGPGPLRLTVRWPDGERTVHEGIPPDQCLLVRQGDGVQELGPR